MNFEKHLALVQRKLAQIEPIEMKYVDGDRSTIDAMLLLRAQLPESKMPKRDAPTRKLIEFDAQSWQAITGLSRDSMKSLQELMDEAVRS